MTTQNNAGGAAGAGEGAAGGEGEGAAGTPPAFNQEEFNRNLQATLSQRDQQLTQTILSAVAGMNAGNDRAANDVAKPVEQDSLIAEVTTEAAALGMDEEATKNFISLATKVFNKRAPDVKKEVKGEIHGELSHEEQKQSYNSEAVSAYPDALDPNSPLRQQARIEYQNLDSHAAKSPRASAIAIESAARKLGIKPITVADIRAREANTENGNGGGNKKPDTGPTQDQIDFAMGFGVKPAAFKKHLAIIQKRAVG